jgi:hypothetical protein
VSGTAVTLRSFTASVAARSVALRWRTASEVDVLGYHVYAQVGAKRVRLDARLILSRGNGAHSYSFTYRFPQRRHAAVPTRFWLQTVNLDGSRQWSLARAAR